MRKRKTLVAGALALVLAACSDTPTSPQEQPATTATATAEPQPQPQTPPGIELPADATAAVDAPAGEPAFDIGKAPVSDAALGDFPYFSLPAGYHHPNRPLPVRDFDRVAVWTGDRLEWVEGRVFESLVHADRKAGKGFSRVEVLRNIDHQVAEAGGVKVAESRVPKETIKAWDDGQAWSPGRGDVYNSPAATWLVRRADRNIWVNFVSNNSSGSWMVIESAPFTPTATLLPSSELREQLDVDGRVAIQVNFAVDKSDILPDSQPQIEQVLALLREDPSLRLSIDGHTDATGDAAHNQRLSEARAQSVVAALTTQGIDASRLQARGHGQSQPVADNDTDAGRAKNRRVELVKQ
ncbi:MAG TPA: OmpA family protein [Luteimonas sp.]|nr:OmpA family protein [Luteimonas sp.]HRO27142.1 OmpA family protein [Luteimonas sp.]HRP73012.1 OmpA family protein [Luteimonas sp.]